MPTSDHQHEAFSSAPGVCSAARLKGLGYAAEGSQLAEDIFKMSSYCDIIALPMMPLTYSLPAESREAQFKPLLHGTFQHVTPPDPAVFSLMILTDISSPGYVVGSHLSPLLAAPLDWAMLEARNHYILFLFITLVASEYLNFIFKIKKMDEY